MNFKKWICCLMCLFSVSGCLKGPSGSPDLTDLYVQAIDITLSANEDFLTRSDSFYCFHSLVGNSGIHAVLLEHSMDFQQFIADKKVDTLQFRDLVVDTFLVKQKFPGLIHWNNRFFDASTQLGMNFSVPILVDDSMYVMHTSVIRGMKDPRMLSFYFVRRNGTTFELRSVKELN